MNQIKCLTSHYNAALNADEIATLQSAWEILGRLAAGTGGESLTDPKAAGEYMRLRLAAHECETFAILLLDTRHRAIGYEQLFRGTIDGAEIHTREVVKTALRHNAAAAIIAHNHPSGDCEPSAADRAVTAQLKKALALVDVRLLDHFVVTHRDAVSLAMRGWV